MVYLRYSLNALKGVIIGGVVQRFLRRDARSLDYSSLAGSG